jgi:hypothetical protein
MRRADRSNRAIHARPTRLCADPVRMSRPPRAKALPSFHRKPPRCPAANQKRKVGPCSTCLPPLPDGRVLGAPLLGYISFSFLSPTFIQPRYSLISRPPARKNAPTRNAPYTSALARSVQHADRYLLGMAARFHSPGESVRHRARLYAPTEYCRQWDPAGSAVDDDRG